MADPNGLSCRFTTNDDHVSINMPEGLSPQTEIGDAKPSANEEANTKCKGDGSLFYEVSLPGNVSEKEKLPYSADHQVPLEGFKKGVPVTPITLDRALPARQAYNAPQQSGRPQGGYPQGGYPQGGYPQGGNQPGGYYPQGGYSQQGNRAQDNNFGPYRISPQNPDFYSDDTEEAFSDEEIRRTFVRNVYTVLSLQLLFTTGVIAIFTFSDEVQEWAMNHIWVMWTGTAVFLISYFGLVCYESIRRSFPVNFIFLILLTFGMTAVASFATLRFRTEVIMITAGLTCLICILVTCVACFCPVDITGCAALLCLVSVGVLIFSLIAIILITIFHMRFLMVVLSGVIVALFSVYLMFDTQMIMGGKRLEMSPEEYILGSVQLYIDMMYIFIHLLTLVGAGSDN